MAIMVLRSFPPDKNREKMEQLVEDKAMMMIVDASINGCCCFYIIASYVLRSRSLFVIRGAKRVEDL